MSQQQPQTEQEVLDILKDFTVDQRDRKTIESEWSQMEVMFVASSLSFRYNRNLKMEAIVIQLVTSRQK